MVRESRNCNLETPGSILALTAINFVLGSPEFNPSATLVKKVVKGIFVNCELLVLFPVNCEISF